MRYYHTKKLDDDSYILEEENELSYFIDEELNKYQRLHHEVTAGVMTTIGAFLMAMCLWIFSKLKVRLRGYRIIYIAIDFLFYYILAHNIIYINVPRIIEFLVIILSQVLLLSGMMRISCLLTIFLIWSDLTHISSQLIALIVICSVMIISIIYAHFVHIDKDNFITRFIDHIYKFSQDILSEFWIYRVFNKNFH